MCVGGCRIVFVFFPLCHKCWDSLFAVCLRGQSGCGGLGIFLFGMPSVCGVCGLTRGRNGGASGVMMPGLLGHVMDCPGASLSWFGRITSCGQPGQVLCAQTHTEGHGLRAAHLAWPISATYRPHCNVTQCNTQSHKIEVFVVGACRYSCTMSSFTAVCGCRLVGRPGLTCGKQDMALYNSTTADAGLLCFTR